MLILLSAYLTDRAQETKPSNRPTLLYESKLFQILNGKGERLPGLRAQQVSARLLMQASVSFSQASDQNFLTMGIR